MIEITVIILLITFILIGRFTKPRQLERPVVIERSGNYHVMLAPRLNLAITFIERIAQCYRAQPVKSGDSATLCLAVIDPSLKRYAIESYLFAITLRQGMLYFQATRPQAGSSDSDTIAKFSSAVLARFPATDENDVVQNERVIAAAQQAAVGRSVNIKPLA